jgi:hypothetical protein
MRRAGPLLLAGVLTLALARSARADEPTSGELVLGGAGMAIPAYVAGVAWHEGSHALWAKLAGAEITEYTILPSVRGGHLYFGYTRWRGRLSAAQTAWILVAPKLTDTLLLGGFSLLVATDTLPENRWGRLALTVVASAAWVDFTIDVFSLNPGNDLVHAHALVGHTREAQRLPWRLLQLGIAATFGYVLYRGYDQVFSREATAAPAAFLLPLLGGSF